jgi:hypothetical protein
MEHLLTYNLFRVEYDHSTGGKQCIPAMPKRPSEMAKDASFRCHPVGDYWPVVEVCSPAKHRDASRSPDFYTEK